MKNLKFILLFLWQLPQNILGLILWVFYKPERKHILDSGVRVLYSSKMKGGLSLGFYSFVNVGLYRLKKEDSLKRRTVKHEAIGHHKQSLFLGWFYLILVGIQSIAHVIFHNCEKKGLNYNHFLDRALGR